MITEWEFTADVAGWINEARPKYPHLAFDRAKCEKRSRGSQKRSDLSLLDQDGKVVLTGEVRFPWAKDGGTPFADGLVNNARKKAERAGTDYFFTWNVNLCVLWATGWPTPTARTRHIRSWRVTTVTKPEHMDQPMTEAAVRAWLPTFLADFTTILQGKFTFGLQAPDEQFIEALEAALEMPISFTAEELEKQYGKPTVHRDLDEWMRRDQGWVIRTDPEGIRGNLERAAKLACYSLVNRLVFHEALLKQYAPPMAALRVPKHITTGEKLRLHIARYFQEAKKATRDYDTVFPEDLGEIGSRIPFYSDRAVAHWRGLTEQIHRFDFSQLDYDVIGKIFERLIAPEERHKYGQFYTRSEVVDLINSFAIRSTAASVMDPACGGGTFLVRAYSRKSELDPSRSHKELLGDLYGVDISSFAAHLSTINLAVRNLVEADNYPQVVRRDFFDVLPNEPFVDLPALGGEHRQVLVPLLDAVVGNPPYVRQEDIRSTPHNGTLPQPGTKEYYAGLIRKEWPDADLSGRSDLHCYFWPHAAAFLKEDGHLCLLTSSQWLDTDYGFSLQKWILDHFEIKAVLESVDEPWFVGARVATTITILRRQDDSEARLANLVRFVQLRRPIRDILAHDGTTAHAIAVADHLRDEILGLETNTVNECYRARLVSQGALFQSGVRLGRLLGRAGGEYYGGKWGINLRAPDLWFEFVGAGGKKLVPLAELAEVRFGIKSGKDCFFFPRDASEEALDEEADALTFEARYGVPRTNVANGKVRLVRCGEGYAEVRPIEAKYLEPEVHSLMEVKEFVVRPQDCSRLVFLLDKSKTELKGSYALDYIKWGEDLGYSTGPTCANRPVWYDLTGHERAILLWPKERQYRNVAPTNPSRFMANCRLYEVYPKFLQDLGDLWAGIANSTWVLLSLLQHGRGVGNEGAWSTMVEDVTMMLVPDPRGATDAQRRHVAQAFAAMKKRQPLQFLSERRLRRMAYTQGGKAQQLAGLPDLCELDMDDRRGLDDAVLQMLGVRGKKLREQLTDNLYAYLRGFFEQVRQKEEKAIANKKKAKRHGAARPSEVAAQIVEETRGSEPELLRRYEPDFLDTSKPFDTYDLPETGTATVLNDMFHKQVVRISRGRKGHTDIQTESEPQARLVCLLTESGERGLVRVPHEADECRRVTDEYKTFLGERNARLRELVQLRTADEDMQEKVLDALVTALRSSASA